jgi:hypothetical protein
MLTIHMTRIEPGSGWFDVSSQSLDTLAGAAMSIVSHHKTATVWLGYLEGWMLTPIDEARLRKLIRKFDCHVWTAHPLSFSHAWKNESKVIYATGSNGPGNLDNNGRLVFGGRDAEHNNTSGSPSFNGYPDQD